MIQQMDNTPIKILYIKAGTCGGCKHYNPIWETIVVEAKKRYKNIEFITLESPTTKLEFDKSKFPKGIETHVIKYPSIFMYTKEVWDKYMNPNNGIVPAPFEIKLVNNVDSFYAELNEYFSKKPKSIDVVPSSSSNNSNQQPQLNNTHNNRCIQIINLVPFSK